MTIERTAAAIRKLVIGIIISEYALMELKEDSKQDLKHRAGIAIKAARSVQEYFKFHPQSTPEHKKIFEKEFLKSEIFMISELMETIFGFDQDCLETIINSIKANTKEFETTSTTAYS